VGVNYRHLLHRSVGRHTAEALYQQAGLQLAADLARLDAAPRTTADPAALQYLTKYIVFDGRLPVPVLTGHTVGDGQMLVENEQAYADAVRSAGSGAMLRQAFVNRAGHVTFTPAEMISAILALDSRLGAGSWAKASPASLNSVATGLGPSLNVVLARPPLVPAAAPAAPGFEDFKPPVFLRPYDSRSTQRPPVN
jgi:hypothetical protein